MVFGSWLPYIDRAPSAVSKSMSGLREVGLLTSKGEVAIPDLFMSCPFGGGGDRSRWPAGPARGAEE